MLWKSRSVSLIALVTLALGIGASSAMFSLLDTVVLRPLAYPEPDRLVRVFLSNAEQKLDRSSLSVADFFAVRDQVTGFADVAAYQRRGNGVSLSGVGETPVRVAGAPVTAGFFTTLGVAPARGRAFARGDDAPGTPATVVVSDGFWRRHLGADPGVVGRSIVIEGEGHTVIGVMPADFRSPVQDSELWPILQLSPPESRPPYWLSCVARLRPGITVEQAGADVARVIAGVQAQYPTSGKLEGTIVDLKETLVGQARPALALLLGAVVLLLFVAAVNVASLQLARGAARERELAIRASLGASRGRLVRQLLVESVLLSIAGGTIGVVLALWGIDALLALAPESLPRVADVHVDLRVLTFAAGLSIAVGVLFGLAPALHGSRHDLAGALRRTSLLAGGLAAGSGAHWSWRRSP